MPASTCVANQFSVPSEWLPRGPEPPLRSAGSTARYRSESFAKTATESNRVDVPGPQAFASPNCVRCVILSGEGQRSVAGITPRGSTAFQQLSFDQLFTWPADQPR